MLITQQFSPRTLSQLPERRNLDVGGGRTARGDGDYIEVSRKIRCVKKGAINGVFSRFVTMRALVLGWIDLALKYD
jgi:hypothetical protein